MKMLAALVLFGTTSAFACPNLSGTFSCTDENGAAVATTITQSEANGVVTYQLSTADGTQQFIADGLTRTAAGKVESGNDAVINVTNTCNADTSLVMDATYQEKDATGATVVDATLNQEISLVNGALNVAGLYTENGQTQSFQESCAAATPAN